MLRKAMTTLPAVPVDPVERAEGKLLQLPQREIPLTHRFAPGCYLREVFMPADTFVIGHKHKTEHFNIVLTGRARVMMDGVVHDIVAPCTFTSAPGVRKVLYILEDMRWATVHPTSETDLAKLEAELITKSSSFLEHQQLMAELEQLKLSVNNRTEEALCLG